MADDTIRKQKSDDMSDDLTDDLVDVVVIGDEEEDMPAGFHESEVFGDENPLLADDIAADKEAEFSEPVGLDADDDEEAWFARSIRSGAERDEEDDEDFGAFGYSIVDGDSVSDDDAF